MSERCYCGHTESGHGILRGILTSGVPYTFRPCLTGDGCDDFDLNPDPDVNPGS